MYVRGAVVFHPLALVFHFLELNTPAPFLRWAGFLLCNIVANIHLLCVANCTTFDVMNEIYNSPIFIKAVAYVVYAGIVSVLIIFRKDLK